MTLSRDALVAIFQTLAGPADQPLGLAVSGGGDSVAMLCLAHEAGLPLRVVTVDHGLREGSAAEARWVGDLCARLGVPHDTLQWTGWDRAGNLQDQARRARLSLMADWAKTQGIARIALGHTRDDQAETVLMRLARRAGADGLSAMAPRRRFLGVDWLRPLLTVGREELRDALRARGQDWIDDPSNEALRFDRVKARRALAVLEPLGIGPRVLAEVAAQMAEVRAALEAQTAEAARALSAVDHGDVVIGRAGFLALPAEIRRRLFMAALAWVGSADYGARAEPVGRLLQAISAGRGGTLAGCRILSARDHFRVTREAKALAGVHADIGAVWDHRWRVIGPYAKGLQVRALGEAGLQLCPDWKASGLPRASLAASPAVWRAFDLVAAPLAGLGTGWTAVSAQGDGAFYLSILSH